MKTKQVLSMNDKMLKMILLVAIFATTQVTLMSAQTSSPAVSAPTFMYNSGAPMEVGDSVMIHKDSLRYLTGERMSTWVYGVPHQIRQLGTKTKPTGVLLRGIYSWIAQGSLIPLNQKKTVEYIEAERAAEQAAEQAAIEAAAAAAAAAAAEASMYEEFVEEVVEEVVEDTLPPAPQPYELDRFSVGVRGGLASLLPRSNSYLGASWGFDVLLDLQYAHYWSKGEDKMCLGVMTGVSVGYMNYSKTVMGIAEQSILGTGNDETKYDVLIEKVATVNHQLQLEVPLMFSMVTPGGLFLNAGPKFIMPVYTPYSQTLYNPMVIATDMQTGVEMVDNPVMGRFETDEQTGTYASKGMNNHRFNLTIALGAEIGYELPLASGHSIGFGVYANYGLYSTYKYNGPAEQHIVTITPPNAQSVGAVEVNSVNNARINSYGYLDAGLKVTYNLNWKK